MLSIKIRLPTALQTSIKSMGCVLAAVKSMICDTLQAGNLKHTAHTLMAGGLDWKTFKLSFQPK